MVLTYGDWSQDEESILLARVAPGEPGVFDVEFVIDGGEPNAGEMLQAAKLSINFYLIDKGEENPWAYAIYHCGTGANVYSKVHWGYFPSGSLEGGDHAE